MLYAQWWSGKEGGPLLWSEESWEVKPTGAAVALGVGVPTGAMAAFMREEVEAETACPVSLLPLWVGRNKVLVLVQAFWSSQSFTLS